MDFGRRGCLGLGLFARGPITCLCQVLRSVSAADLSKRPKGRWWAWLTWLAWTPMPSPC